MALTAEDRAAVQDVVALHGHLTDDGEFDRMSEVFSDDVVYDVTALGMGELHGPDVLRETVLALGDGNPVGHHVTNVIVTGTDDEQVVHALSKGIGIMAAGSCGSVVYYDVVRREERGWRIVRRAVRVRRTPLVR